MGTENENEASFAKKKQKSWTGQPEDFFHKNGKWTMQLNFRLAFA